MKWIDAWYPVILDRGLLPHVPTLVKNRNGEFCIALDWDAAFIADICRHGYMPMGEVAQGRSILLIKSHQKRSVLAFENLHLSRKLKRYARTLNFSINHNFVGCLQEIVAHHHPDTWLVKPLCESLIQLHQKPLLGVAFHSIEIYENDHLVAGEIGYTTGNIYSSLAGFHTKNGSGSVQLGILGLILTESGFAFWDLGMDLAYKQALGAQVLARKTFLQQWQQHHQQSTPPWCDQTLSTTAILEKLDTFRQLTSSEK